MTRLKQSQRDCIMNHVCISIFAALFALVIVAWLFAQGIWWAAICFALYVAIMLLSSFRIGNVIQEAEEGDAP